MTKFSSTKNYLYALLAFMVLALGACSSSDEQPADTSGESSSGSNCDFDNAAMQTECEFQESLKN